ncbi:MAG: NAD(P)/FAD-dependent oxidoreductase [Candidatus Aminicenantes bacterium]|nr:NAD(P)/FAD-dependent oxidoreductase [Candidatus Aminicenantes bacterium]
MYKGNAKAGKFVIEMWVCYTHDRSKHCIMKYDIIVIGAGIGGLTSATKLAKHGKKVLLLEKAPHIGGTSHIFFRHGYAFPMGPMSFGYPQNVQEFLTDLGIKKKIDFQHSHFQLICPSFDLIYSKSFEEFREDLKTIFPHEKRIDLFFSQFKKILGLVKDVSSWHPDYTIGKRKGEILKVGDDDLQHKMDRIQSYSRMPCIEFLKNYFSDERIISLLGSMGTHPPQMSLLNLALMWNIMSFKGIWFPSCGIHEMTELMKDAFINYGGELRTGSPAKKILIENGSAKGIVCEDGQTHTAEWIVSNADYKKTFFELIDEGKVPARFLKNIRTMPYTQSELCVYLGVDPQKVDLAAMRANHLFYRHDDKPKRRPDLEDFDNREMEICLWSDKVPGLTPTNKKALVLRLGFPYDHFAHFRTGEKQREATYGKYKEKLAASLIRTAENILPGLGSSVEVMEIATPLTYRDWGQRFRGSIAGWTWNAKKEQSLGGKILVNTPVPNLLMTGIYAATELFLGGIPTAMHTGNLAADWILEKEKMTPSAH